MNRATQLEHRASSRLGKHEGESSFAPCDRLDRTRDNSQRQLPTDHDYAAPTREYQTDQSSLKPAQAAARFVLGESQRQLQKQPHRSSGIDRVTPYQGNRLVYSHGSATWSILAADMNGKGPAVEAEILTSSEQDASPHVSPAGDKIAFQSWRSGSQEIWTAKIDGSNPLQLTNGGASAGSPSWSHDGRHIAFDARPASFAHIYVISADGGAPRAVTSGNWNDIVPSWSVDDRWIFFGSNRSGSWQVWKIPSDGSGPAQQVTAGGGMVAIESDDAQWLYFTHYAEQGLWRLPMNGGPERKIFDGPPTGNLNYWTLSGAYVYSLAQQGAQFTLQRIEPETGRSRVVYVLKHAPTPFAGVSLTPDGTKVIFAELDRASSGLTLVEHYD